MSNTVVYKQYLRALHYWPKDLLRPEVSFQNAMRRRIDRTFDPSSQPKVVANEAQVTVPAPFKLDEKTELEQANVLYSLLENRYSKKVRTAG
ncbi:MAG: hypothetical protein M1827_000277 [Pycnora praestabilis]|nr:MAG: hypothetical protein M1827_000277 [Pycnora praestabilis]